MSVVDNWGRMLALPVLLLVLAVPAAAGESILVRSNPKIYRVNVEYIMRIRGGTMPSRLAVNLPVAESNDYQNVKVVGSPPGTVKTYPETGDKYRDRDHEGERRAAGHLFLADEKRQGGGGRHRIRLRLRRDGKVTGDGFPAGLRLWVHSACSESSFPGIIRFTAASMSSSSSASTVLKSSSSSSLRRSVFSMSSGSMRRSGAR